MKSLFSLLFLVLLSFAPVFAQNFNLSENKDSILTYLKLKQFSPDPDAPAVIIYEIGSSLSSEGFTGYRYEVAFKVFNAKNIGKLADIVIPKRSSGVIKKVNGTTYNFENGNISVSKIEKSDIIVENYNEDKDIVKFNMPAVKDGSVVTYTYTYENGSPQSSWIFQHEFPVLYSRFNFERSMNVGYTPMVNTTHEFKEFKSLDKMEASAELATSAEEINNLDKTVKSSWVRRNLPAFSKEEMMGVEDLYLQRLKLVYNGYVDEYGAYRPYAASWEQHTKEVWYKGILEQAFQKNNFLNETVSTLVASNTDSLEMAKAIFYYVQKSIRYKSGVEDINKVFNGKQGNQAGINKLLCAMLRAAGLRSDMIILSDRYHEQLNAQVPNPMEVTDAIVRVELGNTSYFLDASQKILPFGYLPLTYYNGYARIVNRQGMGIYLDRSLAINASVNTVYISPQPEDHQTYKFKFIREYGVYSGADFRKKWIEDSTTLRKELFERGSTGSDGIKIENVSIENTGDLDKKIRIITQGKIHLDGQSALLIMDPFMKKVVYENPIKEIKNRKYPVVYDHAAQEKYKIYISLNDQYTFDDYPVEKKVSFGADNVLNFACSVHIDTAKNAMLLQYQYDHKAAIIAAEEVGTLKEFYDALLKIQNQKIIFKKRI